MAEIELDIRHSELIEALRLFDECSLARAGLAERGAGDDEPDHFLFAKSELHAPEAVSRLSGVRVEHRGRHEGWGLVDDLIVHCSKRDAWNLGLWLIASVLHAPDHEPVLQIGSGEEPVRTVRLIRGQPLRTPFQVRVERYLWCPAEPEAWLRSEPTYRFLDQRVRLQLHNSDEFDFRPGYFERRDELRLYGTDPALLMLAEFLLHFGGSRSDLNYEYLNRLLDDQSCDARIQLPDIQRAGGY